MKNRFFAFLVAFSLVNFGGLVVASEVGQYLIVYNHPCDHSSVVNQVYRGPFLSNVKLPEMLNDQKETRAQLGIQDNNAGENYFLATIQEKNQERPDGGFNYNDIIRRRGIESGYGGNIAIPSSLLCDKNGTFKKEVIFNEKKYNVRVLSEKVLNKENNFGFIKPLAGFSVVAFLGFICWAYKNNVSSQDMQEAFVALFSKLCNVVK